MTPSDAWIFHFVARLPLDWDEVKQHPEITDTLKKYRCQMSTDFYREVLDAIVDYDEKNKTCVGKTATSIRCKAREERCERR